MTGTLFRIFKGILALVGGIALLLIVISKVWPKHGYRVAAPSTAVFGTNFEPCQFSIEVPGGFWTHDTETGTNTLVRVWNKSPHVYLYAQRWFKPRFPGDWFIATTEFKCSVAPRAVIQGKHGASIQTFVANQCQTTPDVSEHFKDAKMLYAQVPVGDQVDVIAFTSRSEDDLMKLEPEFRQVAASHFAPPKGTACPKGLK